MTEVSYSSPAQTLIPHKRGPGPLKHVQSAHSSSSCFHLMIISHTLSRSYSSGQYSFNTTRIYNRSLLTRKGLLENCLWPRRIFICIIIINLVRHCILLKKKKRTVCHGTQRYFLMWCCFLILADINGCRHKPAANQWQNREGTTGHRKTICSFGKSRDKLATQ